ncbi:MAG TPA: SIMPL domain-containing protein [Caulobacteraceae bacterium]|jgi:hypothetical protein|nr:SIMPL domain-containing protein [Caulobacteraceae bacterium]
MKALIRAGLACALLASTASVARAEDAGHMFDVTTLSLSAHGETRIVPDQATVTLGVQTTAPVAAEAMRENAARMSAVTEAVRRAGVADRDIQTSNLSLSAQYVYAQNEPAKLTGYQASNDVTITVEDLTRLGPVIDAVTAAGANQINGIGFGLKDSGAAEDQARLAAVKALRSKAELYAGATGYHVARLVNLSEGGGYAPGPAQPLMRAAVARAPTPVSAGELTVGIDVTGLYELAK